MLQATTMFYAGSRFVQAGEIVTDNDPVVAGREHLFAPIAPTHPVEEATARPGTRRAKPKKSTPKKSADD